MKQSFHLVISNSGYIVERAVLVTDAKYNDSRALALFGIARCFLVTTRQETHVVNAVPEAEAVYEALGIPFSTLVFGLRQYYSQASVDTRKQGVA